MVQFISTNREKSENEHHHINNPIPKVDPEEIMVQWNPKGLEIGIPGHTIGKTVSTGSYAVK